MFIIINYYYSFVNIYKHNYYYFFRLIYSKKKNGRDCHIPAAVLMKAF